MSRPGYPKEVALLPSDADTKLAKAPFDSQKQTPILMPEGRFLRPGVVDALESGPSATEEWHPNSPRTRLLVGCVHACKDIAAYARGIDLDDPWREKRAVALVATPLVSLCDHTKALSAALGPEVEARRSWSQEDKDLLQEAGRRLKQHQKGPLRKLRNTRTAHHDLDTLRLGAERGPALEGLILPPLGDSLVILALCFNYRRVYTWKRRPTDAGPDEIEIMTEYPVAIRVRLDVNDAICAVGDRSCVAEDPLGPLRDVVFGLFDFYNAVAVRANPAHPTLFLRPARP